MKGGKGVGAVSSRSFDLLNSMIYYDLKRSVDQDDCLIRCYIRLSSSFCTMPFKCPSMPFQIAFLYDIILRGMPFQMPFQIDVKLFERAFGRACPSTFYHTKGQFERALKGI